MEVQFHPLLSKWKLDVSTLLERVNISLWQGVACLDHIYEVIWDLSEKTVVWSLPCNFERQPFSLLGFACLCLWVLSLSLCLSPLFCSSLWVWLEISDCSDWRSTLSWYCLLKTHGKPFPKVTRCDLVQTTNIHQWQIRSYSLVRQLLIVWHTVYRALRRDTRVNIYINIYIDIWAVGIAQ